MLTSIFSALMLFTSINHPEAPDIKGLWFCAEMRNSKILIYEITNGSLEAKITESDDPDYLGKIFVRKCHYVHEEKLWVSEITNLNNGIKVEAKLSLQEVNTLKVTGTKFFISKTYYWKKVAND
ncbi:MAG: DUF2147 domain-containing protein [Cyclobacteriaceae bacterium]|nr:DUF2147 domain-containing protein [Cyclobacteriaceae bacterium HetDA_MAG_MS6]